MLVASAGISVRGPLKEVEVAKGRSADAAQPDRGQGGADAAQPGGGQGGATAARPGRARARAPRWARLCAIFGAVLMIVSGGTMVATTVLLKRYEGAVQTGDLFGDDDGDTTSDAAAPEPGSDIKGPLTVLLVGIDPRRSEPNRPPLADSIMIAHIPATMDRAYLFSLPRDLIVDIPAFRKADFGGGRMKINSAMAEGSRVPGQEKPDPVRGFELLSKTITKYTGIQRFDAGAIINFSGFKKIVDAMGGVTMYVDETTRSEHLQPNGKPRPGNPYGEGYIGPQKTYKKGEHHLKGWEALDYVRQRYGLKGGDYARQRHQQQFIKAMTRQAFSRDVVTNPVKLDAVLRAAGESLVFNGRGRSVVDYAFALKKIRPDAITMVKLPGQSIIVGGAYQGEEFEPLADDFFAALRDGTVDDFIAAHPELVQKDA
jgi:anionic cell wall polymer biosynthesis LytR-Cps2A-Psr (LCP) family protein